MRCSAVVLLALVISALNPWASLREPVPPGAIVLLALVISALNPWAVLSIVLELLG
ncbi:MAG: hypothetical protein M3281_06870 [Chloroflexota bacterium]|nr:hypothetical protein [Chloroflexota bacterium]